MLHLITDTRHLVDSSGRGIGISQSSLPDKTQQSQWAHIHAPGGIRTRNPRKRAATDPRISPRGHWAGRSIHFNYCWKEPACETCNSEV